MDDIQPPIRASSQDHANGTSQGFLSRTLGALKLIVSTTPSGSSGFHQSTVPTGRQGRLNSNDDPHTVPEYPLYSRSTQGDGRYERSSRFSSESSSATQTGPPYGEAIFNNKCPACHVILGNNVYFINSHIDLCLGNCVAARIAPSSPSALNWHDHETSEITNGNSVIDDAPNGHHQYGVVRMEVTGTTSRPRDDENSTVYLVEIPQSINEAYIIDKFSTAFGEVLCCEIGRQTRIGSLKFASHENAKKALAAESMLFSSDKGATLYKMNIKKKATATLFVEGNLESLYVTDIQNHLSKVFTGHWKCNVKSEIQDVLAFDCDFQAAEKTLVSQGIIYKQKFLTVYTSVIYLEELPPTATCETITNVLQLMLPTIRKIKVIVRSGEGIAVVLLPNSASKEQLLALNSIQINSKKAMIFGEAVPKVCIEEIPYELLQQPRDELIGAIFGLKIFQGVITKVDLRNRERMAIVWLTDTEARCRVLKQSLSFVPVIRGCPVHISAIRAMPTIGKSNNNSTVYLVGIPQNVNDAFIIDKFSIAFGKVLCCEIGPQTRIGSLKFAHREYAEIALAAECMLFPSDKGATPYGVKIKKKATATLFIGGNLGNLQVTDIQNHLSKVFRGHWKYNTQNEIQDVLAFDCNFEAAEKALLLEGISYNRHILTFYISVIYLEELPPSATSEKIANVFRSQIPTIGNINVIIRSDEGVALVLLPNSATKEQLLALKNIQIDNKKAMLFSEAVPKVYIEDIPLELFQQHRDILTGAIFDLEIFQGVITKVDLRIRERMAIVWLKDTTARCSVLGLCQSLAPILKGRPVLISAIRARPAIWEFDDEWYQSAQVPGSIDQYAADDPVFLRNWEPEIWKQWKSKYASDLAKAKDDRAISRVNQQIHGIRVTVMLATLSAIRNGYYYASEPNPAERITIHPPRQSSESFTFAALPPASNNIYNHTSVSVIKEDCLLAALSMKKKGLRPVVLNMASATSPGGGYRKGDGAQEENIFRRSNYFLSLDDPINPRCPTYPMAEFGGIYTPDVTVFRDSEDSGYAFRQEPFTMDFIAVAAYRKPWLQNNCLSFQDVAKTRRKIEAIFAIALHKGHDSLLLSALGCGAFQNPPNQIASIFLAVAQQYSRKFRKIVFAITEDHNSITTTNPAGNYDIFSLYLDHTNLGPGIPTLPPVTVLPVTVPMVATCSFGGCCDKFDTTHTKEFYHPPSCPFDKGCKNTDDHHIFLFRHIKPCKRKGLCIEHDDPGHAELFSHPSHCENGGGCTSMEDAHLQQFLHVPVCAEGVACSNREVKQHAEKFRHIKSQCPYGSFCGQYMVVPHMEQCVHPFNTPCRGTPFACTNMDAKHVAKFSHVCKYGAACPELLDLNHVKNTIHVVRTQCPHGANCMHLLNEKHLNLFSHLEIADIRSACKYGQVCTKRSRLLHVVEYAHTSEGPPISSYDDACQDVDFSGNAQEITEATDVYFTKKGNNFQVPEEVVEWVKGLRPAHRVRPKIFKSILAHHHVMSANHIRKLKNPMWASHEARHHPLVRQICEKNKLSDRERMDLEDLVKCAVLVAYGKAANDPQLPTWETDLNLKIEAVSSQFLTREQIKLLIDLGDLLVKATRDLANNPVGVNYDVDKLLGTNKQVFGILGPHTGYYYGDIILLFKQDIMNHPQSNITPNAATSFWSGRESNNRPFMPKCKAQSEEAVKKFHNSKLHPSCRNWAKAAAADICAQIMETTGKTHLSLNDVKSEWLKRESHFVFEAHLPSLIPLSFVEKIIIPKNIWDSKLTVADKQQFRLAFPNPNNDVIIFCDPVGGDVDGRLDLTDDRRKLINTAMEHCSSPNITTGSVHRPLGMSVSLERGKGAILPLPFRFSIAGDGNIYFRAKGSEFFIMLTEKQTKESSNNGARITFYFGGPKSHILYITRGPPSAHRVTVDKKNWVAQDPNFDQGFADGDWVNYHIQMNSRQKICKVDHWGHSQIYNRRTLVLNKNALREDFSFDVQWLGIGVWKNQVSFESIEVHRKPLPETNVIQWTPQMTPNASISRAVAQWASTNAPTTPDATATTNAGPIRRDGILKVFEAENRVVCSLQTSCFQYNDAGHCRKFSHPFVTPCRNIAICKHQFGKSPHNQVYSHLCRFGNGCRELNDTEHQRYYIHKHLPKCHDYQNCVQIGDWSHRESFLHDKLPCILIPCNSGLWCAKISDLEHIKIYKHNSL